VWLIDLSTRRSFLGCFVFRHTITHCVRCEFAHYSAGFLPSLGLVTDLRELGGDFRVFTRHTLAYWVGWEQACSIIHSIRMGGHREGWDWAETIKC
jgi:hypothetical protein